MCGIVGIHSLDGSRPIVRHVLNAMNRALTHRGPDSEGYHEDPGRIGLGMRRLSIIDVAGGDQPISNEDASIWIVFNGEIYNYREVRKDLEARGHRFRTHTDTEAIVHAYEEFGDDCVNQLRGMFAFAVWDAPRRRLLLARDRVGIKPLYYTVADGQLIWGSEIKAVLQHPAVPRRMNPSAINHFLTYLYVTEPLTAFEGIHELPAGHVLVSENGSLRLGKYWQIRYDVDSDLREDQAAEELRARLDEAVRLHLISDVPLGAFLSGGIDSGAIVALMARNSNAPVETFSMGYEVAGEQFDERSLAREVAKRYGTNHHEFVMEPDLTEVTRHLVRAFDQPAGDASAIPTWYISKYAREHVTVALSGVGGDELAAGYERHRGAVFGERLRWIPAWLVQRALHPLTRAFPDSRSGSQWVQRAKRFVRTLDRPFDDRYFELLAAFTAESRQTLLTPEMLEQIDLDEPRDLFRGYADLVQGAAQLNRALFADLKLFLPSNLLTLTDRMSMAHSLEVRVPYLDHPLLEYVAHIPPQFKLRGMKRKHILKRAVADLLPDRLLTGRKMGFSLPLAVWFRKGLRPWVEDILSESAIRDAGVFRYEAVRRVLDDHFSRRASYDDQIWGFITFMTWYRDYIASADGVVDAVRRHKGG